MSSKSFYINRRNFLKGATAAAIMSSFGGYGFELINSPKPWRVALIGAGWYGSSDLFRLIQVANVEVVAICDVDERHLRLCAKEVSARQQSKKIPELFKDYRKLLKQTQPDIVLIGTPDHWHALQCIEALKAGAHVYLQKPVSVDVLEGEAVVAAARKYGKVVQIGTQRRSTPHLIHAKEQIVDAGLLGKISHAEICCYFHMRANGNPPVQTVPDFFDYDLWTGPAPLRPYDGLPHKRWWRTFMEYGNGIMGDMCVHMLDAVRWMLDLGWPKKISSSGGIFVQTEGKSNIADTQTAIFEFETLNCVWQHRSWGNPVDPEYPWAFKLFGEKGTLSGSPWKYDFVPYGDRKAIHRKAVYEREKYPEDLEEKDIELHAAPATRLHLLDLLHSIEKGSSPVAEVSNGHISSASCILANIAMESNQAVIYDPAKRRITNHPELNLKLQRPYRAPWEHPLPEHFLNK